MSNFVDSDSAPMEKARIEQLESLIDRVSQRAGVTLKAQGEALRQRLYEVGARQEPRLIMIGEK